MKMIIIILIIIKKVKRGLEGEHTPVLFSSWLLSQACETLGKEHFRQREEQMLRPQVPFSRLEYGVSLYTIKCLRGKIHR